MLELKTNPYPPKIFFICNTKEEFIKVFKELFSLGHCTSININDFEIPKKGIIVWLKPTLMSWCIIETLPNTLHKRNKLITKGFEQREIL